jgi:radical SAM protein with 4Fe4S-binding SPASM domain
MSSFYEYRPIEAGNGPEDMRILLHPTRPQWVVGNRTMGEIVRLLEEGKSCDEAGRIMAARFNIDPAAAARDVKQVADRLKADGFLSEEERDPIRIPRLASLFVYVTNRCNLSCSHCYRPGASGDDIPLDPYRKMVDELREMGGTGITLTGGEPLLHPRIRELLSYGGKHSAMSLLTNGVLLDKETASFLSGLENAHIQVSIDGSRKDIHDAIRGKGAFENALKGIGYLQEAGLGAKINLCATIMARNLSDLPQIIDLAGKLGVPGVRFLPLRRKGRAGGMAGAAAEGYTDFFDHIFNARATPSPAIEVSCGLSGFMLALPDRTPSDDAWCPVGKKLVVTPQGDAYPCALLEEEEFALGNVFRKGLAGVMASERLTRACAALMERKEKIDECARCLWKNLCQAGCMGEALEEKGTVWERGRFCEYRRRLYEQAFTKILNRAASFPPGERQ